MNLNQLRHEIETTPHFVNKQSIKTYGNLFETDLHCIDNKLYSINPKLYYRFNVVSSKYSCYITLLLCDGQQNARIMDIKPSFQVPKGLSSDEKYDFLKAKTDRYCLNLSRGTELKSIKVNLLDNCTFQVDKALDEPTEEKMNLQQMVPNINDCLWSIVEDNLSNKLINDRVFLRNVDFCPTQNRTEKLLNETLQKLDEVTKEKEDLSKTVKELKEINALKEESMENLKNSLANTRRY